MEKEADTNKEMKDAEVLNWQRCYHYKLINTLITIVTSGNQENRFTIN